MMLTLHHHPAYIPAIPMAVEAGVAVRADGFLVFSCHCRYQPHPQSDQQRAIGIALPAPTAPVACDNLWQHTCCEAFVSVPGANDYFEFNFAPSGCWAVYRFNDYRIRDESFQCSSAPSIALKQHAQGFELAATVSPADLLSRWPQHPTWQIGLSAVMETTDHRKSYWAIRHDELEKPDFHVRTQFLLPLHVSTLINTL